MKKSIIESLRELPALIRQAEIQLWDLQNELAELRKKMELWKATEMGKIAKEVDEFGHRRFPNDALRNAELARRKTMNEEWRKMEEYEKNLSYKVRMAQIERDYQRNRLKVGIAITQLEHGGEVRRLATPEISGENPNTPHKSERAAIKGFRGKPNSSLHGTQSLTDRSSIDSKENYWQIIKRRMEEFAKSGDQVRFIKRYRSEFPLKCELCGHPEIINVNVIKNMRTGKILKIGSVCVTRYEKVRAKYLPSLSKIEDSQRVRITRKPNEPCYDDLWPEDSRLREVFSREYDGEYDFEFDPAIDWGPAEDDPEVPKWYGGIDPPSPDSEIE